VFQQAVDISAQRIGAPFEIGRGHARQLGIVAVIARRRGEQRILALLELPRRVDECGEDGRSLAAGARTGSQHCEEGTAGQSIPEHESST
jgi:hypothetical protein